MTEVPQIRVETTTIDSADGLDVTQSQNTRDGWLAVPSMDTPSSSVTKEDQQSDTNSVDEQNPQPWLGTLYITVMNMGIAKRPIKNELVWVQVYRKYPSVGSRIGLRHSESQSYALFFPAAIGGNQASHTSPNPCAPPLLCLNLRHSTVVPLDEKRFALISRSGDRCSLQAEVTNGWDLDYWLTVFRPSPKNQPFPGYLSIETERMVRSAPSSPERKRRIPWTNGFVLASPCCGQDSMEPLNDIQECEGDE